MFTFWSIVWAFVILSFFNGLIHWQIPKELQIPDFLLKKIGGLPSFYGYNLELDTEDRTLEEWLQDFVDEELDNLPVIEFRTSQSQAPICSLTKSSRSDCLTKTPQTCNRNDERCPQFWTRNPGKQSIQCLNLDGKALDCNLNGYFVQNIYHNEEQITLIMSNSIANTLLQQKIIPFQSCETHFVKEDNQTFISIPIPEMREGVSTKELTIQQNVQTTIFYNLNDYNKNATLLWTLVEAHMNSSKFCNCKTCYELKNNAQTVDKNIYGFTAQLLSESNTTMVNFTANYDEMETETVGKLVFRMRKEVIDRKTPVFWRRSGRFDCPSELTCPFEFLYISQVQSGLILPEYVLEILFILAVILYQRKGSKKYF